MTSVLSGKPYPAAVEIDGNDAGDTPLTVKLAAGDHKVRVLRAGFQTTEKVVNIKPHGTATVDVDLIP